MIIRKNGEALDVSPQEFEQRFKPLGWLAELAENTVEKKAEMLPENEPAKRKNFGRKLQTR